MSTFGLQRLHKYKILYAAIDLITILVCLLAAFYVHREQKQLAFFQFFSLNVSLFYTLLGLSVIFIFIFRYNDLYKINTITTRAAHFTYLIKSQYYGTLSVVLISLLVQSYKLVDAGLIYLTYILLSLPVLYLIRIEFLRELFLHLKDNFSKRNVVIVGDGKSGELLAAKFMLENHIGIEIVGFVDNTKEVDEEVVNGKRVLGKIQDLRHIIKSYNVNEIIVAIDNDNHEKFSAILDSCKLNNITVRLTSELSETMAGKLDTERYFDIPVVEVSARYNNNLTLGIKRLFDLIFSFAAIIIFSPLLIILAFIIKVSSKGSVLFSQTRIGRYGKPFKVYKFRTMGITNNEKSFSSGPAEFKVIHMNRLTWIGKLLRKTSLDELPQIFNVLKGEMSFVGPRPFHPYEYDNFDEFQKKRLSAKPGFTGVWQVCQRSGISFKDSLVLDLYYLNNMSPWFDLQLIFKTIPAKLFFKRV